MAQDKLVQLGQAVGRIMALESVLKLGDKGFNTHLIDNAVEFLKQDINTILCNYQHSAQLNVVEDYQVDSSWLGLVSTKS